jgi:hypothetical protein
VTPDEELALLSLAVRIGSREVTAVGALHLADHVVECLARDAAIFVVGGDLEGLQVHV